MDNTPDMCRQSGDIHIHLLLSVVQVADIHIGKYFLWYDDCWIHLKDCIKIYGLKLVD